MRVKLSKTTVKKALAGEPGITWDEDVRGFGLRVHSSGRGVYILRLPGGKQGRSRWLTIGDTGTIEEPDDARDNARRLWGLRAEGVDVAARRDRARDVPDLAAFADRYLRDYAVPQKKPATVAADRSLLGLLVDREGKPVKGKDGKPKPPKPRTILGALGRVRVDRVAREDVARLHASLRATPTRANRVRALLSHMFAMAEQWGERSLGSNPTRGIKPYRETRRERFLSAAELGRLGAALAQFENGKPGKAAKALPSLSPWALGAIRLLVFTGARASEVLNLRRDQIDLAAHTARLAQSKTGAKTVFLNPPALAVLKALPRLAGNPYVIAGRRRGQPLTLFGLEQVWQQVRAVAKLEDVRLHDLRHSFASVAVAGGATLPVIGALLGHSQPSITARYAHLAASPLVAASTAVAAQLKAALDAKPKQRDNLRQHRRAR